jgi:hypothetical protein
MAWTVCGIPISATISTRVDGISGGATKAGKVELAKAAIIGQQLPAKRVDMLVLAFSLLERTAIEEA